MSTQPQKGEHRYTASGPAYRRLRTRVVKLGMELSVQAIDRLERFEGTEDDVRRIADLLRGVGEHETAASLLRNLGG